MKKVKTPYTEALSQLRASAQELRQEASNASNQATVFQERADLLAEVVDAQNVLSGLKDQEAQLRTRIKVAEERASKLESKIDRSPQGLGYGKPAHGVGG